MSDFLDDLAVRLKDQRATEVEGLLKATDWADFQRRRGVVQGIERSLAAMHDLLREWQQRDDEEE
jgi:hypothetical protein